MKIYQNLISIIEDHADEITNDLVKEFRKREETWHYRDFSEEIVYERVHQILYHVYQKLGSWLNQNMSKDVIFAYYTELGRERFKEGIPLQEVVMVLLLVKRKLWKYMTDNRLLDSGYGLNQMMEMNYYISVFFDRIVHSVIIGYQEEMGTSIGELVENEHLSKAFKAKGK